MNEFDIIKYYFDKHSTSDLTILGIGDDAAISRVPQGFELVSCVDTMVSGRHFLPEAPAKAVGHKAVAVNLSDLAAMGACPYAILLALSLPSKEPQWLEGFAKGLFEICQQFGVALIGGDTTASDVLSISVTALGLVPMGQAICRKGAQVGDLVCVSGEIGSASFALHRIWQTGRSDYNDKAQEAMHYPIPQVELGQRLRGYANAMIDVSDGLGQDLGHILNQSGVSAALDLDKIPCLPMLERLPDDVRWQRQINGGDDYQLCLTISPTNFAKFNQQYPNAIIPIGKIIPQADEPLLLYNKGIRQDFVVQGFSHF